MSDMRLLGVVFALVLVVPALGEETATSSVVLKAGISLPKLRRGPFLFAPDGKAIIQASDESIETWNVETGDRTEVWPRASESGCGSIDAVAVSSDGRLLVEAGSDGVVRVWNANEGKLVRSIRAHVVRQHEVHTIERDGKVIEKLDEVRDVPSRIGSLAVSADGKFVAAVGSDDTVSISDTTTGIVARRLPADASVTAAFFLPDGKTLATVHAWRDRGTKPISFWNLADGKHIEQLSSVGDPTGIGVVAVSGNGQILAGTMGTSGFLADPTIRFWNLAERRQLPSISPPDDDGYSTDLAVSPDGCSVAAVSGSNRLTLWSVTERARMAALDVGSDESLSQLCDVRFSPDNKRIAVQENEYRQVGDGRYEGIRARVLVVDIVSTRE